MVKLVKSQLLMSFGNISPYRCNVAICQQDLCFTPVNFEPCYPDNTEAQNSQ